MPDSPAVKLAITILRAYQYLVSPLLGANCRYFPTCSQYAVQAVRRFGVWRGGWLALRRVGRCHPRGGCGDDPVPEVYRWWGRV